MALRVRVLGPVSLLDCVLFLAFLAPALMLQAGFIDTVLVVFQAVPFLLLRLPIDLIRSRLFTPKNQQAPFFRDSTWFEEIVVRCVRFAFTYIPPKIGRVFFSKPVAIAFKAFRELRHGKFSLDYQWKSHNQDGVKGLLLCKDQSREHDIVIFYVHGGGFAMGSPYFYMEFLLAWLSLLVGHGFENPAIFAPEYSLVPDAIYPVQANELVKGYEFVLKLAGSPRKLTVAGDSAGANLVLGLLLHLGSNRGHGLPIPRTAVFISPWVTLVSPQHKNTTSDYIDAGRLHHFGLEYAGNEKWEDPLVSPGSCTDLARWKRASPDGGIFVNYGSEEVLGPEIENLVRVWKQAGVQVSVRKDPSGIHAWPVASMFLSSTRQRRMEGLENIVGFVSRQYDLRRVRRRVEGGK